MKRIGLLVTILAVFALVWTSCEKDPGSSPKKERMIIENNLSSLSKRVSIPADDYVLPFYPVPPDTRLKSLKYTDVSSNYVIKLRAEVASPVFEGKRMQASHIRIIGNYAFVAYNRQGPEFLGGFDIFDVSDISNPVLISNAIFPYKDISSFDYESLGAGLNNFIYTAGAENMDYNSDLSTPAIVERFILNSANQFQHVNEPRQTTDVMSYVATDIKKFHNRIYVTSGSNGGLTTLNPGMQIMKTTMISDARSIDADNERLVVLKGTDGEIFVYDRNGNQTSHIVTGGAGIPESKSMVRLMGKYAFAALGELGMKMYDLTTGLEVDYLPRPIEYLTADTPENYVSNGVSVNDRIILVANGGAGVYVAQLTEDDQIALMGSVKFESGSSANFIEARDNKVFVATGLGGLKILEIVPYDPGNGDYPVDPIDPEPTIPCPTLYDKIVSMLPERFNIEKGPHADLLHPNMIGSLLLTEKAPVFITWVHDGAGWNNTFGYYYYDADNPPASVNDLQLHVVLPYTKKHDGSNLKRGDRFRLGGPTVEFNANTRIGFFLVSKGWDPGTQQMVGGLYTNFTERRFNHKMWQQHTMFLEETCNDIVVTFEDIRFGDGGDKDFNDFIFVVSNGDDQWGNQTNYAISRTGLPVK